jgi:hypothetical protein
MAIASARDQQQNTHSSRARDAQTAVGAVQRPLTSCGPACEGEAGIPDLTMTQRDQLARAVAGLAWLAGGGLLATRQLPGGIALWPAALVPTWFGISHLVAAVIGYRGCPELGAIPTVFSGRPVPTVCEIWERIDGRIGGATPA